MHAVTGVLERFGTSETHVAQATFRSVAGLSYGKAKGDDEPETRERGTWWPLRWTTGTAERPRAHPRCPISLGFRAMTWLWNTRSDWRRVWLTYLRGWVFDTYVWALTHGTSNTVDGMLTDSPFHTFYRSVCFKVSNADSHPWEVTLKFIGSYCKLKGKTTSLNCNTGEWRTRFRNEELQS